MITTLPGSPWYYRVSATYSVLATGTVCADSGSGRAYLLHAVVTFDASGAGKWWLWQGTTATIMVGPFYTSTCNSWTLNFSPIGYPVTTTSLDIGYVFSTTGNYTMNIDGYTV